MDNMSRVSRYSDQLGSYAQINVINLVAYPEILKIEENLQTRPNQIILKYGGMSNGVVQMIHDIREEASRRPVEVIRIWSHGFPGGQAVSVAEGISPTGQRAGIAMSNFFDVKPALRHLRPVFAPGSRAELRACHFAEGDDGIQLLYGLADLWQVPVYAAVESQPVGPIDWVGMVYKVTPQGHIYRTSGLPVPQ